MRTKHEITEELQAWKLQLEKARAEQDRNMQGPYKLKLFRAMALMEIEGRIQSLEQQLKTAN